MTLKRSDRSALAGADAPPVGRGCNLFKMVLLAGALAAGGLLSGAAEASPLLITTSGVVSSGSDPADLLGAGTDLAGDSYTLTVLYNDIGPAYFTNGSGTFASDIGDPIRGYATVTVDGHTLTSGLQHQTSATLLEDLFDLFASNSGTDAAGDFTDVSQDIECVNTCVPFADLQTGFSYVLQAGDIGLDTYSFTNAAGTATASFTGASSSLSLHVPEPASWALLVPGLLGLGMVVRRRRA